MSIIHQSFAHLVEGECSKPRCIRSNPSSNLSSAERTNKVPVASVFSFPLSNRSALRTWAVKRKIRSAHARAGRFLRVLVGGDLHSTRTAEESEYSTHQPRTQCRRRQSSFVLFPQPAIPFRNLIFLRHAELLDSVVHASRGFLLKHEIERERLFMGHGVPQRGFSGNT